MPQRKANMLIIDNNLRRVRTQRGLSQVQLATKSGIWASNISVIEQHHLYPNADIRERLAETLDVSEVEIWPNKPVGAE